MNDCFLNQVKSRIAQFHPGPSLVKLTLDCVIPFLRMQTSGRVVASSPDAGRHAGRHAGRVVDSIPVHPKAVKRPGETCQLYSAQTSMQAQREETLLMVCRSVIEPSKQLVLQTISNLKDELVSSVSARKVVTGLFVGA